MRWDLVDVGTKDKFNFQQSSALRDGVMVGEIALNSKWELKKHFSVVPFG